MLYSKTWIALSLLLSTTVACISSVHPISPPETAYYDEDLIGAWVGTFDDEEAPFWAHFFKAENSLTEGVLIFPDIKGDDKLSGLEAAFIKVFPSRIGDRRYLNIKPFLPEELLTPERREEIESAQYELVMYQVKDDLLSIWALQNIKQVLEDKQLQGIPAEGDYDSNTITASSTELTEFLRTADHQKYFKKFCDMHRMTMPTVSPQKPK